MELTISTDTILCIRAEFSMISLYEAFELIESAERSLHVKTNEMWLIFQYVTKSWSKHLFVDITRDPVTYWQMPVTYSKSLPPQQCQLLEAHSAYLTHTHTHSSFTSLDTSFSKKIIQRCWMTYSSPKKNALRRLRQKFCKRVFPFLWVHFSLGVFRCKREWEWAWMWATLFVFVLNTGLFSASVPFPQLKCIHIWLGSWFLVWSMLNEWFIFFSTSWAQTLSHSQFSQFSHTATCQKKFRLQKNHGWIRLWQIVMISGCATNAILKLG